MVERLKTYETIACCGLDCGLCPRYYTNGSSRCGGCGGHSFQGNPSCWVLNCCVKKGLEVCGQCNDYPCERLRNTVKVGCDSFTTHKKIIPNIEDIKNNGLEQFLEKQKTRIDILKYLLSNHDDGRSKGFFCISCTLLPIDKLQEICKAAKEIADTVELKERCKLLRKMLKEIAAPLNIELKLTKNK